MALVAFALFLVDLPAAAQSELVIHKEGTSLFHRPGCALLRGASDIVAMSRAEAESRGYKAHADCDRETRKDAPRARAVPPETVTVFLNDTKYYHRKDCRRLDPSGKAVRPAPLERAGKTHWPCPECRPPVRKKSSQPAVPGTGRRGR